MLQPWIVDSASEDARSTRRGTNGYAGRAIEQNIVDGVELDLVAFNYRYLVCEPSFLGDFLGQRGQICQILAWSDANVS